MLDASPHGTPSLPGEIAREGCDAATVEAPSSEFNLPATFALPGVWDFDLSLSGLPYTRSSSTPRALAQTPSPPSATPTLSRKDDRRKGEARMHTEPNVRHYRLR
jgi:hypothetical protein